MLEPQSARINSSPELTPTELQTLASAAVTAPSADNAIRWKLHAHGLRLQLRTPDLSRLPATRRRLDLISIGCVVESLRIQASALGFAAAVKVNGHDPCMPSELELTRAPDTGADPLADLLAQRHSNRSLRFRGPRLDDRQKQMVETEVAQVPGAWLHWLDSPATRALAVKLIQRAEVERFQNQELHAELFSAVRFDLDWRSSCSEGLPPGSLGVAPLERPGFKLMRHWRVQRMLNFVGAHHLLGLRSAGVPVRLAPHVMVLGAPGPEPEAAIAVGRALQRAWTRANALGMAAQVLAASPLYALPDATAIAPGLRSELAAGWQALTQQGSPYIALRLGHAPQPSVRSGRPAAASVLA